MKKVQHGKVQHGNVQHEKCTINMKKVQLEKSAT